ncbi:hypothetical protein HF086_006793 [Spodoptera exigua]|uniref:CCHC-type domain-containing protein n=1 Tax=Spodoptera exigua TaxID=7107 RepID=A0A922M1T6_SPOEX|nr:hypothetical protein HF086_006793 [Spodoptera exigua]
MPRASRERLVETPPRAEVNRSRRSESSRRDRHRSRSHGDRSRVRSGRRNSRSRSRGGKNRLRAQRDKTRSRSRSRLNETHSDRSRTRGASRSRERSRSRSVYSRRRQSKSRSYPQECTVKDTLSAIMSRLIAIEENTASDSHIPSTHRGSTPPLDKNNSSTTQTLTDAIGLLVNSKRSNSYYVSNFDPAINNFEVWCNEVERAKLANHWDDFECFSRVAHCLRGDAKVWLNEWSTNDRSWFNFVKEFKSLCPQKINYAQILHEVINTTSERFLSYAEYARRSLLRLRVIKGLSEELMVQVVIHGISDVQVRAAATNADLTIENLVSFLSTYVKPARKSDNNRNQDKSVPASASMTKKRHYNGSGQADNKCFTCGQTGHFKHLCPNKRNFTDKHNGRDKHDNGSRPVCSFCKKLGHKESDCFTKARSEAQNSSNNNNQRKVNLCSELSKASDNNDICTAVIQGIPVDVLIDSGALNVSLISSAVVNYFSGSRKPINCSLKGIGDRGFVARECITLTVEFSEIALEVDFVIVPALYMNTPIIVGTDVLNHCDDDDSTDASGPSGTAPASPTNAFVNPTGEDEERRPSPPEDVSGAAEDGARSGEAV